MKRAAVLPSLGIGDALLMMVASHQLKMEGYQVTTFHDALPELSSWFPGHEFSARPECLIDALPPFDLILAENDNSPKIKELIHHYRPRLSIFYPTYSSSKHAPLSIQDYAFDPNLPMADNIAEATASLLDLQAPSKENGIAPLPGLVHRANEKRILIHPTSSIPEKNWKAENFIQLAHRLKTKGYEPLFCVGPRERNKWINIEKERFVLAEAPTLSTLASLIYGSGYVIGNDSLAGHLGSNLGIPTLIIANDEKRMRLWRPGWQKGHLVLPQPYLPNWKFLRLREKKWQNFITVRTVLRRFDDLRRSL